MTSPRKPLGAADSLSPVQQARSGSEQVYTTIRERILNGAIAEGARLKESELALALGVSRTPIREALRMLSAEGIVEFVPNRGATVLSWSQQDLDDIFALRAQIEGHGARLAALKATPADIESLRTLTAQMDDASRKKSASAMGAIEKLNGEFHRKILQMAGNRHLSDLAASLMHVAVIHRTFQLYSPEQLARSVNHHKELVAAFAAGDGDWAEAVMRSHIFAARSTLSKPDPS